MKPKNSPYYKNSYNRYRGGFITTNPSSQSPKNPVDNFRGPGKVTLSNGPSRAKRALILFNEMMKRPVSGIVLGGVINGVNSLVNNSKDRIPYASKEETTAMKSVNLVDLPTQVHRVRFNCGFESTASVKAAERQNGSAIVELFNSLKNATETKSRQLLSRSFGFNQKVFDFLLQDFYPTIGDYKPIFNLLKWNIPEHSEQVSYGLVMDEYSNLKIKSSNTYHNMIVKIHVVKILEDDLSLAFLFGKTFNRTGISQTYGAIPYVYQRFGITKDDVVGSTLASCLYFEKASLTMSSNFKTQAKVVKTFSKRIRPGDTIDFRMKVMCGPGIRFDIANSYLISGIAKGTQPSSYGLIVEAIGTEAECIRKEDGAVFQGTAPGWFNYEYSKAVKVVKHNTLVSSSSNMMEKDVDISKISEEDARAFTQSYAVKVYQRDYLTTKPFNADASKIGDPSNKEAEFYIVSTGTRRPVYSVSMAANSNSTGPSLKELEGKELENYNDFDKEGVDD